MSDIGFPLAEVVDRPEETQEQQDEAYCLYKTIQRLRCLQAPLRSATLTAYIPQDSRQVKLPAAEDAGCFRHPLLVVHC